MADKRIKDLDAQSTRTADLLIAIDKASGLTEARTIRADILAPKINELSVGSISNRATELLRFNDAAGNEYKITINDVYKLIKDLGSISADDALVVRLGSTGSTEYKITLSNIASYVAATMTFNYAVTAIITAQKVSWDSEITISSSPYGHLYLEKFGKLVNGIFKVYNSDTDIATVTETLPASLYPREQVHCNVMYEIAISYTNHIYLNTDGSIEIEISFNDPDVGRHIPIAYITA